MAFNTDNLDGLITYGVAIDTEGVIDDSKKVGKQIATNVQSEIDKNPIDLNIDRKAIEKEIKDINRQISKSQTQLVDELKKAYDTYGDSDYELIDSKNFATSVQKFVRSGGIFTKELKDIEDAYNFLKAEFKDKFIPLDSLTPLTNRLKELNDLLNQSNSSSYTDAEKEKQQSIRETTKVLEEEEKKRRKLGSVVKSIANRNKALHRNNTSLDDYREQLAYGYDKGEYGTDIETSELVNGITREFQEEVYNHIKQESDNIDTKIHSHPSNFISTASYDDIGQFLKDIDEGIEKQLIVSMDEVTHFDFSQYDDKDKLKNKLTMVLSEYSEWYNNTLMSLSPWDEETKAEYRRIADNLQKKYNYSNDDLGFEMLDQDTAQVYMRNQLQKILDKYNLSNLMKTTHINDIDDSFNFEDIYKATSSSFTGLEENANELKNKIKLLEETISSLRNEISELQSELYNSVDYSSYDELAAKLDKAEQEVSNLNEQLNNSVSSESYNELVEQLNKAEANAKELKEQIDALNKIPVLSDSDTAPAIEQQSQQATKSIQELEEELQNLAFTYKNLFKDDAKYDFEFETNYEIANKLESILNEIFSINPDYSIEEFISRTQSAFEKATTSASNFENILKEVRKGTGKWSYNKLLNNPKGFSKELDSVADEYYAMKNSDNYNEKDLLNIEARFTAMLSAQHKLFNENSDYCRDIFDQIQGNIKSTTSDLQDQFWEAMANGNNMSSKSDLEQIVKDRLGIKFGDVADDFEIEKLQELLSLLKDIEKIKSSISKESLISDQEQIVQRDSEIAKELEDRLRNTSLENRESDPEWVENQYKYIAEYINKAEEAKAKIAELKNEVYELKTVTAEDIKNSFLQANQIPLLSEEQSSTTVENHIEELEREEQQALELIQAEEKLAEARKEATNLPSISNENIEHLKESEYEVIDANERLSESAKETYEWVENEGNSASSTAKQMTDLYNAKARAVEANIELRKSAKDSSEYLALEGKSAQEAGKGINNSAKELKSYFNILNSGKTNAEKYRKLFEDAQSNGKNIPQGYETQLDDLDEKLKNLQELKDKFSSGTILSGDDIDTAKDLNKEIKEIINSFKGNEFKFVNDLQISKLDKDMSQFATNNKRAEKEVKALRQRLKEIGSVEELKELISDFDRLKSKIYDTGKAGKTFGQQIKDQFKHIWAQGFAQLFGFYDFLRYGREMVSTVTEIDTAITELRKVSNATEIELSKSFKIATADAKELGATINEVINAQADWSRLGYNLEDAQELAKISTLYTNVGDGISMDDANQSLISTLQGFQLQADDAMSVIDKFNEVANNYAIDSAGIGDALQRSAAAFNAANTDLSQSIAIVTTANTVAQDPEKIGNAFTTLSARIRGSKAELESLGEETDAYVESTSKLRDQVKAISGVDIMEDENTYKDIYTILLEIGKVWNSISDIDQSVLLESIAGKRQSNIIAGLLNNADLLEQVYETAENSTGSAMREQMNYEKSIQYSMDRLKASSQEWVTDLLNSGLVKWFVDLANSIVHVSDVITPLGTGLAVGGIFSIIKQRDNIKSFFSSFD